MADTPDKPIDGADPYELTPTPKAPTPVTPPPKPKIDAGRFIDEVDDDADLTHDPEVERALGKAPRASEDADDTPARPALVLPGRGEANVIAAFGAGVALAAVVAAAITSPGRWFAAGVGTAYLTLVHTGTGVLALGATAHLQGMSLGRADLAAARMLLAVALFQLVFNLALPGPPWLSRGALTLGAVGLYVLAVWALFKLRRDRLLILAGCHAGVVLALWILVALHAWASSPATVPA